MDKILRQLRYIKAAAICMFFALCGNLFKGEALTLWFVKLRQPEFTLPVLVFFVMGGFYYVICGVLLYKLFSEEANKKESIHLLTLMVVMMAYYALWDLVFFGLQSPLAGFIAYVPFIILVFYIFFKIAKIYPKTSVVFLPFIGWLGYGLIWLISLWSLN